MAFSSDQTIRQAAQNAAARWKEVPQSLHQLVVILKFMSGKAVYCSMRLTT
jgi:hypothetical protein